MDFITTPLLAVCREIRGIPLKKGPPLLGTDLEQGGPFLSVIRSENPGRRPDFLGFYIAKTSIFKAETVQKARKKLKIFACGGSGQEESSGRGLNKVKYQMFMIFIKRKMVLHLHKK